MIYSAKIFANPFTEKPHTGAILMEIKTTQLKRTDVVDVDGRIDSFTAPNLEEVLTGLTTMGRYKIVIDMSDVDFMSSKGWWVLIETQKACKRYNRGEVVLVGVQDRIRESLDLVGMGSYFKLYDDITAAVGSF
jgi:anti-sigma B factor antagonist